MKKVIFIEQPKEETKKPVEFTYNLNKDNGWVKPKSDPSSFVKIIYLGKCPINGDFFACYYNEEIRIYKGHLNSGEY